MINVASPVESMEIDSVVLVPPKPQQFGSFGWGDFDVPTATIVLPFLQEQLESKKRASPTLDCFEQQSENALISPVSSDDEDEDEPDDANSISLMDISTDDGPEESRRKPAHNRTVTFASVQVREHAVELGEHPWCNDYPLTLSWQHSETLECNVDEYEQLYKRKVSNNIFLRRLSVEQRRLRLAMVNEKTYDQLDQEEMARRQAKAREHQRLPVVSHPALLSSPAVFLRSSTAAISFWDQTPQVAMRCEDV